LPLDDNRDEKRGWSRRWVRNRRKATAASCCSWKATAAVLVLVLVLALPSSVDNEPRSAARITAFGNVAAQQQQQQQPPRAVLAVYFSAHIAPLCMHGCRIPLPSVSPGYPRGCLGQFTSMP